MSKLLYIGLVLLLLLCVSIPVYADYYSGQSGSAYNSISSSGTSDSYLIIGTADVTSYQSIGESWEYWVTAPDIDIVAADSITYTSARLRAQVTEDGDDTCEVRFGLDTGSHADFADYARISDWENTLSTGSYAYLTVTGLAGDTPHYFRAQVRNDHSTVTSGESNFSTSSEVGNVLSLYGIPSNTSIILTWQKGDGSTQTIIRYSTSDYPTSVTDGTSAYDGTGFQCTVSGLTAGQVYYFTAWGYANPYSPTEVTMAMSTSATGTSAPEDLPSEPDLPDRATQAPDASGFNLEPFTSMIDWFNTGFGMPEGNLWELLAILGIVVFGIMVYIKVKVFLVAFAVVILLSIFGVGLGIIQGYLIGVEIVVAAGVWAIERYMQ